MGILLSGAKTAPSDAALSPFPKHQRFWLAGLARALPAAGMEQPGNPSWSCPSLHPPWQCLGAGTALLLLPTGQEVLLLPLQRSPTICPQRTPIPVLSEHRGAFLNRECISTAYPPNLCGEITYRLQMLP